MPAVLRPRRPEDFDAIYAGTPPWETGRPQPALVALAEAGAFRGRDQQPGYFGPRRITQDEIRATFGAGWRIDSIEPAMMDNAVQRDAARCWLATITRT
jgi:hypothetical protein